MKTANKIEKWQQGDVILKSTTIPKKEWGKKVNHLILQKSDISQHAHVVKGQAVLYATNKADEFFLEALENVKVAHEEHKEIKLPKGKYFVYGVKEFDPFEEEIRRIRD
jgi:hypothetical protein